MKNIKKVATHNGIFHADEVVAISLLKIFGWDIDVTRMGHQTPKDVLEGFDFVIDIGREYDGQKFFDHHQYQGGKASAGLIWDYIQSQLSIKGKYPTIDTLVKMVDDQDTGVKKAGRFEFPQIVTSYNSEDIYSEEQNKAFNKAVDFACDFILSLKKEQDELQKAEEIANNARNLADERLEDAIELPEFHRLWNTQFNGEKRPEIGAVIWFDVDQQKWKAQVTPKKIGSFEFNGKKFLPDDTMEFVHSAGFFAVAKDRKTLISFLKNSRS